EALQRRGAAGAGGGRAAYPPEIPGRNLCREAMITGTARSDAPWLRPGEDRSVQRGPEHLETLRRYQPDRLLEGGAGAVVPAQVGIQQQFCCELGFVVQDVHGTDPGMLPVCRPSCLKALPQFPCAVMSYQFVRGGPGPRCSDSGTWRRSHPGHDPGSIRRDASNVRRSIIEPHPVRECLVLAVTDQHEVGQSFEQLRVDALADAQDLLARGVT